MDRNKRIGLWAIVLLQFNAAVFFISNIVFETLNIEPWLLDWNMREYQQVFQAVGLLLGVVLGWIVMRMGLKRTRLVESKLRQCTMEFSFLMEEHFTEWNLTSAERDIALFLVKGLSTREIAEMRGTSEGTVKAQTNAIYRKAKVTGRPQLLSLFIEDLMEDALMPAARPRRSEAMGIGVAA